MHFISICPFQFDSLSYKLGGGGGGGGGGQKIIDFEKKV